MVGTGLIGIALVALIGCSGAAGSPAAPAGATAAPTVAAASQAAASAAAPDAGAASGAIPSFTLPSSDKELEALLPAELCGAPTTKFSFSGDSFADSADPEFLAVLSALGKTAADVSFAVAGTTTDPTCSGGIFRVKGVDSGRFKEVFLAEAKKAGNDYQELSLGGKTVLFDKTSSDLQYAYFKDDAIIFAGAADEATAATVIAALP